MSGPNLQVPTAAIGTFDNVGDIAALGTTQLTELAKAFEQFSGNPLAEFFQTRTVENSVIMMERVRMGVGIAPLVRLGGSDAITDGMTIEQRPVTPFTIRESDFIPQHIINILRQPGSLNTKYGEQMVAQRVQRLTQRSNFFWQVMMTKLVAEGGISYTDKRTGESVSLDAGLPTSNIKSLVPLASTNHFSDLRNSRPIDVLRFFRAAIRNVAKAAPNVAIMSSELRDILTLNSQIIARQEGFGGGPLTQFVEFSGGDLVSIAGMRIVTVDTIYEDPVTNTKKKVFPINKITLMVTEHPEAPGLVPGRMDYCIGEDPAGRPGLWMRDGGPTLPPYAPGRAVQMGNTGVPYLLYPEWVGSLTVGEESALNALIPQNPTGL